MYLQHGLFVAPSADSLKVESTMRMLTYMYIFSALRRLIANSKAFEFLKIANSMHDLNMEKRIFNYHECYSTLT